MKVNVYLTDNTKFVFTLPDKVKNTAQAIKFLIKLKKIKPVDDGFWIRKDANTLICIDRITNNHG